MKTQTGKIQNQETKTATSALQRNIIDYLDQGNSLEDLKKHIQNEIDTAYAIHEEKTRAKEAKAKAEKEKKARIDKARKRMVSDLILYYEELGLLSTDNDINAYADEIEDNLVDFENRFNKSHGNRDHDYFRGFRLFF